MFSLKGIIMENGKEQISLEELLYYILFAVISFSKGVGLDEGELLFRVCLLVGIMLLACKFLIGKYSILEIVIAGVMGIWGIFTFKITGSLGMFIYIILIIGMKNVPVKRIFITGVSVWGICMFFSAAGAVFAGRTGVRIIHERFGMGPILRESLGYTHPNVLHITYALFMTFLLYLYIENKKKILYVVCLLLLGNAYVFMYSMSSTGMLMTIALLVLFIYFDKRKCLSKTESLLIQGMPLLCVMFSIVLPLALRDGVFYEKLNRLFHSRIWAVIYFFDRYKITLFGSGSEGMDFSIDNSYVGALHSYGLIPLIIMIAVYSFLLRYYIKKNGRKELAVICTFLFAGLSEPFLFNASIKNITVIFIGHFLYEMTQNGNNIFQLFSKYNRLFSFPCDIWAKMRGSLSEINWKRVMGVAAASSIVCFLFLFPGNRIQIEKVYGEESLCDVRGDTLCLPKPPVMEKTLYIENISEDVNYYCFTNENSHLIEVMDLRYKISVSLYAAAIAGMLYACGQLYLCMLKGKRAVISKYEDKS